MATTYTTELQKLYVAYFNRPADPAGLAFWEGVVEAAGGSTVAASAAFAASAEYKAAYAGMNNTQIINQVYQNLFSHAPDVDGRTYWVKALTDGVFTIDQIVAEVAGGAQTTDKTTFTNKVTAASAFTAAVDTAAEKAVYTGDAANAAAVKFIAGITTDASLSLALTPATLDASVAAVVKAGTAFTLAGGLADLDAANDAIPAFLKSLAALDLDGDDDLTNAPVAADITAEVTAANTAVGLLVADYAAAPTVGQKAAILADFQTTLNGNLTTAQTAYTTAVTAAGKVAGLNAAIASAASADANLTAVTKAEVTIKAAQAAAEASYESLHAGPDAAITINATTGATVTDVGAVDLLVVNSSGNLVLATGVTEKDYVGVTALLNAVKAELVATKAITAATAAAEAAHLDVSIRDTNVGEAAALAAVGAKFTVTTPADVSAPTAVEIQTEILGLKGAVTAGVAGAVAAQTAFNTALDDFNTANTDPISGAVTTATTNVTNATKAITALDKAVIDLATANGHEATLTGLKDAVDAAKAAFADHDFVAPVTATGFLGATTGIDIFLAGTANGTIANFGLQGKDVLYVGSDMTLNSGKLTAGNAAVLEVFLIQNGASTDVVVETKSFGSATTDHVTITLSGVAPSELTFSNGIISHV